MESWILDPAEYRIFGYIRLYSAFFGRLLDSRFSQGVPEKSWISNIEYSACFGYIQEVLNKSGCGMDIYGGPPPGKG